MCIISQPIVEVASTKILVALSSNRSRQLVVYSNRVDNIVDSNAMILPVPNPMSVKFHDLSKLKNIFKDLNGVFMSTERMSYSLTNSFSGQTNPLEVFDVGSYKASLALSVQDILRVNTDVFKLSKECYTLLSSEYPTDFGFIICKLKTGNSEYHPFGYSHTVLDPRAIFVPTKHFHAHSSGYDNSEYEQYSSGSYTESVSRTEDWDHEIYLYNCNSQGCELQKMSKQSQWLKRNPIRTEYATGIDFDFGTCMHMEKHTVKNHQKNIDILVSA